MSPSQLLERIQQLGSVDKKYVDRIRGQIEDPEKTVKPKAVIGYLLKKNQITKQQGVELLRPPEDELFDAQPTEKDYDTGALIADDDDAPVAAVIEDAVVAPVIEHSIEVFPEPDATIMDAGQMVPPGDMVDVQPIADPFTNNDPAADYSSGAYATQSGPQKTLPSFAGKRDQTNQFQTKWVYIAFGLLGAILIGVTLLSIVVSGQKPEDMFEAAMDAYNRNAWPDAQKKLTNFADEFPSHKEAEKAKALATHASIRQIYQSSNYAEMIKQSDLQLQKLVDTENPNINNFRDDLGLILPDALMKLSDQSVLNMTAKGQKVDIPAMKTELGRLTEFRKVIDNPIYVSTGSTKIASNAKNHSRIENNFRTIAGQIEKETRYIDSLAKIKKLGGEEKTDEAFVEFRKLIRNYSDLGARKELVDSMLKISETESRLVKPITPDLKPLNGDRPSITNSVVLSATSGQPLTSLEGEIVPFLAEGAVYGMDAGKGTFAWRRFVGLQTTIAPVTLDADRTLISDQANQDIICVDTATGKTIWRHELGEAFQPPAVSSDRIIVSTSSGRIIEFNPATGEIDHAAQLPQAAGTSALISQRDPFLYQVGSYSNLYVISTTDYTCSEVYSLGHFKGAVAVPPVQWTGYIIVAVNGGGYCDLHVLKPAKNGLGLIRTQFLPRLLDAPVTSPIAKAGNSMMIMAENGQIQLLDIDPTNEGDPIQVLEKEMFGEKGGPRPFLSVAGSHVWIAGDGIAHAKIKRNQGKLVRDIETEARDQFLTTVTKLDDFVFHVRRRNDSGMISASVADAFSLKPIWRTDFAGQVAGSPVRRGDSLTAINNQGDVFSIGETEMNAGFSANPKRASTVVENLQFSHVVDMGNGKLAAIGPRGRPDMVYTTGPDELKLIPLSDPANKPTGRPLRVGEFLLLPTTTGQVARVDPKNGTLAGSPFQPGVSPTDDITWLEPVSIKDGLVGVARTQSKGSPSALFVISTNNASQLEKVGSIEPANGFKNRIASDGENIFGVLDNDGVDKLVAYTSNPIAEQKSIDLTGSCVAGPWFTEAGILLIQNDEKLYCYDSSLTKKWSVAAPNNAMACSPELVGPNLMLCFQSGVVQLLEPSSGKLTTSFDLKQPIKHRPLTEGQKMYFSGLDGTVHAVDLSRLSK